MFFGTTNVKQSSRLIRWRSESTRFKRPLCPEKSLYPLSSSLRQEAVPRGPINSTRLPPSGSVLSVYHPTESNPSRRHHHPRHPSRPDYWNPRRRQVFIPISLFMAPRTRSARVVRPSSPTSSSNSCRPACRGRVSSLLSRARCISTPSASSITKLNNGSAFSIMIRTRLRPRSPTSLYPSLQSLLHQ